MPVWAVQAFNTGTAILFSVILYYSNICSGRSKAVAEITGTAVALLGAGLFVMITILVVVIRYAQQFAFLHPFAHPCSCKFCRPACSCSARIPISKPKYMFNHHYPEHYIAGTWQCFAIDLKTHSSQ